MSKIISTSEQSFDIDFSSAGFTSPPAFVVSVERNGYCKDTFVTVGIVSVNSGRIYFQTNKTDANTNVIINWIAIGV